MISNFLLYVFVNVIFNKEILHLKKIKTNMENSIIGMKFSIIFSFFLNEGFPNTIANILYLYSEY